MRGTLPPPGLGSTLLVWNRNTTYKQAYASMKRLDHPCWAMQTPNQPPEADSMLKRSLMMGKKPRIGIVGAGVAGLRAADVLLQHGLDVTILEARARLGGRIAQGKLHGHLVDLGPNWIHGTDDNPILALAHVTKTVIHSWGEHQSMFDSTGASLGATDVTELQETFWDIITKAFRFSNEHKDVIKPGDSLMDFFRQEVVGKFTQDPANLAHRKRDMLIQTADMWGAFIGSPIERQSLKYFWLEECIEGENPFVAGTYARILAKIAEPALGGVIPCYERVVKAIANTAERVKVTIEGHDAEIFDEVIVTIPLGCLKAGEPAFSPALPARLQKAISSVGYGCLDKVYITFPSAFWQPTSSHDMQTPEQKVQSAQVQAVRDSLKGEEEDPLPGFMHWLAPVYATSTNPQEWSQECINLAGLPGSSAHPTLLFYIFGPCSQHIANLVTTLPPTEIEDALISFFLPYISRLSNYDATSPACKPVGALATAWANDKFSGHGSYSNFQVGLEAGDKDIECMREGMPERHIWLAGEHTAPFVALGTVTGAYWAGEGVAKRIVAKWAADDGADLRK